MTIRTDNISIQALMAQAQSKLTGSSVAQTSTGSDSTTADKVKKLAPSLAKAQERIAAQYQTASTTLSALGQFKSSLVDLDAAGQALGAVSATTSTQAVQAAVEKFIASYNATVAKGAGSSDTGVSRTLRELRSGINATTSTDQPSLSRLGITQNADGTLVLDAKALAKTLSSNMTAAVAALSRVGKSVDTSASHALDADSRLSSAISTLGTRTAALKKQEAAVVDTATRLGSAYGTSANWNQMVIDTYLKG